MNLNIKGKSQEIRLKEEGGKMTYKTIQNNKMAIGTYISIIN